MNFLFLNEFERDRLTFLKSLFCCYIIHILCGEATSVHTVVLLSKRIRQKNEAV